jgi:arylsulfatase A-like enzyme
LAWRAFSSALTAAFLNLGSSTLDRPRALWSWPELALPFVAGFVVFFALALGVHGLRRLVGRSCGDARAALDVGVSAALVLAAALHPLVEAGLREATGPRAAVVLACGAGFVLCAGWAMSAWARARPSRAETVATLAPVAAFVALVVTWVLTYHVDATVARVGLALAALAAGGLLVRASAAAPRAVPLLLASLLLAPGLTRRTHGSAAEPTATATSDQPPVVLITVDTLRADRVLGAQTSPRVPTPAIDALTADSVVFSAARSAAPWTKPSLATLLTGLSPLVHGMTNRRARLPEEVETLAERLRAEGYHTAGFGLNAHLERAFRFDQGFDDYGFPARQDYGVALGARLLERLWPARFPEIFPSTTAIAEVAVDWLEGQGARPFFLWLHVLDPHWPYEPPEEWLDRPHLEPRRWGDPAMVTNVQAGNTKPGASERARVAELYAGEIRYVDHELARVLGALRERGLYERALIVFASDHGEEFWEHGHYEHGHTLYDEVLRVPLAFKLPGSSARSRIDAPVSTESLYPTVLDALGFHCDPESVTSPSLAPWWRAPAEAASVPLFATGTYYFGEKRGVVYDGQKLVVELDTGRVELYDLVADPSELVSLAAARPEACRKGLELIEAWQERCAEVRARLGIRASTVEADPEVMRMLNGLGYLGAD